MTPLDFLRWYESREQSIRGDRYSTAPLDVEEGERVGVVLMNLGGPNALDDVDPLYDVIVLDCPPSTSLLTLNAMIAGDALIIPVSPGYLALEGIVQLGDVITQVRSNLGDATPVLGLLLTMVERDADESAVISQVRDHYGEKVFATEVRTDPALRRAAAEGTSIFQHAPSSSGSADHAALAEEVLERIAQYSATPSA